MDGLRGNFPIWAPSRGARQAREQQKLRPTVIPLPPPPTQTTRPLLLPLPFQKIPWDAYRGSPSPGGSGLGQQRQKPRLVARSRVGSSWAPLTLECEAPLDSLQFCGLRANFSGAEPHEQGAGVRPGREVAWGTPCRNVLCMLCTGGEARLPKCLGLLPCRGTWGNTAVPTYFFLLHEPHKGRPLDLHGLALSVVEGQNEVEEVGFPQIGRRLLLKVSPGQTHPAAAKDEELDGLAGHGLATPCHPVRTRLFHAPPNAQWAPPRHLRRPGPTRGRNVRVVACPVLHAEHGARPPNSQKRRESSVWVLRRR